MKIIGLTGNSGSGKTEICKLLRRLGAYIIDSDKTARIVVDKYQPAYNELAGYFGDIILNADKSLNRKLLADIAFADAGKHAALTRITHFHIIKHIKEEIANVAANLKDVRNVVIDAPLLIEAGLHEMCDAVWVVDADKDIKIARIITRDGLTKEMAEARLNRQMPIDELRRYASAVIVNNGDLIGVAEKVNELWNGLEASDFK